MEILFTDALLLPMTEGKPRTFTGALGISGNRIELVSDSETERAAFLAAHPDARVIDCRGKLVMPGFGRHPLSCWNDPPAQLCRR